MKTKREMFAEIRNAVADNEEMVTFLNKEIALLEKKANTPRKKTSTQLENEKYREMLFAYLVKVDTPKMIKEIKADIPEFTNANLSTQRITHMLTALIKENKVVKGYVKKVPYYSAI